jgi:hypothetical protein
MLDKSELHLHSTKAFGFAGKNELTNRWNPVSKTHGQTLHPGDIAFGRAETERVGRSCPISLSAATRYSGLNLPPAPCMRVESIDILLQLTRGSTRCSGMAFIHYSRSRAVDVLSHLNANKSSNQPLKQKRPKTTPDIISLQFTSRSIMFPYRNSTSLLTKQPLLSLICQTLRLLTPLLLLITNCTLPLRIIPLRDLNLGLRWLEDVRCAAAADVR